MKKFLLLTSPLLLLPLVTFAQAKITPLINIPGLTDAGGNGFSVYINFLYAASISIAALLAVIKIIIAGVKYMLTDVISTKSNAKGEIQGALLGLLLILGAYIILYIINPRLVSPTVQFQQIPDPPPAVPKVPSVKTAISPTPAATPGGAPSALPPNPSGQPPATTTCSPSITSKVIGSNTFFTQNLTGCSVSDVSIYRKALEEQCKSYGTLASGTPPILTCGVATYKIK